MEKQSVSLGRTHMPPYVFVLKWHTFTFGFTWQTWQSNGQSETPVSSFFVIAMFAVSCNSTLVNNLAHINARLDIMQSIGCNRMPACTDICRQPARGNHIIWQSSVSERPVKTASSREFIASIPGHHTRARLLLASRED